MLLLLNRNSRDQTGKSDGNAISETTQETSAIDTGPVFVECFSPSSRQPLTQMLSGPISKRDFASKSSMFSYTYGLLHPWLRLPDYSMSFTCGDMPVLSVVCGRNAPLHRRPLLRTTSHALGTPAAINAPPSGRKSRISLPYISVRYPAHIS